MEFFKNIEHISVEEWIKLLSPLLVVLLINFYKYIIEDRNSIERIIYILYRIMIVAFSYYMFLIISYLLYGENISKSILLYFFIFIPLEYVYIITINKSFKLVKYNGKYYKLLKQKNEILRVQTVENMNEEYSKLNLKLNKEKRDRDNTIYIHESLEFGIVSFIEIPIDNEYNIERITYYLDKNSSSKRELKIKRKLRGWTTIILLMLYVFSYFLPNPEKILPIILLIYLWFTLFYVLNNMNVLRLANKLHIIETLKRLNSM